MSTLSGTSLADYGHPVFQRDGYVCVYCGFDGNDFRHWRQLAVSRLHPDRASGMDSKDNQVTACHFCNSVTSRMEFSADQSADEILKLKRARVKARLKEFYRFWSDQVAQKDVALSPERGGAYLPHPLILDFSSLELTDYQLAKISSDNGDLRIELTTKGELVIVPPTFYQTGWQESEMYYRLRLWAEQNGTGFVAGASPGFWLPNGAVRAPDATWLSRGRWEALSEESRRGFPRVCPDFVLEVRSESDSLALIQEKMLEYMENGARLGWLIDPTQKRVHIYRPGEPAEILEDPATVSGEPVLPGFELNVQEIW